MHRLLPPDSPGRGGEDTAAERLTNDAPAAHGATAAENAAAPKNGSAPGTDASGGPSSAFTVPTVSPDAVANAIIRAMLGGATSPMTPQTANPAVAPRSNGRTNSGAVLAENSTGAVPAATSDTLLADAAPSGAIASETLNRAEPAVSRKPAAGGLPARAAGSLLPPSILGASAVSSGAATPGQSSDAFVPPGPANGPLAVGAPTHPTAVQALPPGPLAFGATIAPKPGPPPAVGTAPASATDAGTGAGRDAPPRQSFPVRPDSFAPGLQTARTAKTAAASPPAPADPLSGSPQPDVARGFTATDITLPAPVNGPPALHGAEPPGAVEEIAALPAAPPASAKQDLLLRIPAPESSFADGANPGAAVNVDIRVTQRAGEVLVTVHTPDAALQAYLRQDLPELVNSLDRAGFETATFTPRSAALATAAGAGLENGTAGNQAHPSRSGGGFDSKSGNSPRDSGAAGQFSGGPAPHPQQARDRLAQHWLDQMEK
ncbi:MAG TPA: hypothetical protein VGR73_15845 [Bryobacteraceae bacterium]|nr:hypothetical protein [Bryobacteraceae bacterium]